MSHRFTWQSKTCQKDNNSSPIIYRTKIAAEPEVAVDSDTAPEAPAGSAPAGSGTVPEASVGCMSAGIAIAPEALDCSALADTERSWTAACLRPEPAVGRLSRVVGAAVGRGAVNPAVGSVVVAVVAIVADHWLLRASEGRRRRREQKEVKEEE